MATPQDLLGFIESTASTLGLVLEEFLGEKESKPKNKNNTSNQTDESKMEDDLCSNMKVIDLFNADKPGAVEYETDIGDSGDTLYEIHQII